VLTNVVYICLLKHCTSTNKVLYLTHFLSNWVHLITHGKIHTSGAYWALFGIVVMAKYRIFFSFHPMKYVLLVYHEKIFTDVWHCLFTDQTDQKDYIRTQWSLRVCSLATLYHADKGYLYLFVKSSKILYSLNFCLIYFI
jgi:hypothetical protein